MRKNRKKRFFLKGKDIKHTITINTLIQVLRYGPNLDMSEMMKDNNVQPEEQIEEVMITNIRIWWTRFVYLSTWWIPSSALKYIGRMPREDVQMAWREKVTLCILIFFFSAGVIFCIVGLGIIICPEAKDLYTAQDVLNHQSMNDYWISIRGKVYEVTKFVAEDHGSPLAMTTSSSLESLAGRDLSYTFPPPLTVACAGLVDVTQLWLHLTNPLFLVHSSTFLVLSNPTRP